ncbi:MAG: aminotransferase class III-fold pyridoxal phosphate-dependent enzyme [candidate division Zixibacteria bacterium]|nr:aminotransferase class III-fold pyridoxal phosphate-dependent enzyme [candidate division Zixibacteria bacterium]
MAISFKDKTKIGYSTIPDKEVFDIDDIYGAKHYRRLKTVVRKTQGAWLYTQDGRKILDCLAAYSAANAGHHHPKIVAAMIKALQENYASVISNVVYTDVLALFLKRVATLVPQLGPRFGNNGNKVLPKNGGVESVETAIKLARYFGWKEKGIPDGKQEIIVYENNFHGRMITIISFSTNPKYKEGFGPLTPGFKIARYGNLDDTEKLINQNTCAILVEPMQGEGGMYQPPKGFLKGLRELADKHNLLLLFDEIQVGMGRTGKTFCFQHENVVPDAVILGKAIAGGMVPVSVMVANRSLMDMAFSAGSDGSTFGGYPLAAVAGLAALDLMEEEKLVERSAATGKILKKKIMDIAARSSHVKEVRGEGLFIGVEVKNGDAMVFCEKLLKIDMLCNDSHHHTIRISPPLIINDDEVEYIAEHLEKVLVD